MPEIACSVISVIAPDAVTRPMTPAGVIRPIWGRARSPARVHPLRAAKEGTLEAFGGAQVDGNGVIGRSTCWVTGRPSRSGAANKLFLPAATLASIVED